MTALSFDQKIVIAQTITDEAQSIWDVWLDLSISVEDAREIIGWANYEMERNWWTTYNRSAQRRAMRLLRSMLSREQKRQLRQGWTKSFMVVSDAGSTFRLYPSIGQVWRVELHGKRWINVAQYCLHTDGRRIPPADETIAHMLQIVTSEVRFMLEANEEIRPPIGWQQAIEWGRCNWRPSWATKEDIEIALADMLARRQQARDAAAYGLAFEAA